MGSADLSGVNAGGFTAGQTRPRTLSRKIALTARRFSAAVLYIPSASRIIALSVLMLVLVYIAADYWRVFEAKRAELELEAKMAAAQLAMTPDADRDALLWQMRAAGGAAHLHLLNATDRVVATTGGYVFGTRLSAADLEEDWLLARAEIAGAGETLLVALERAAIRAPLEQRSFNLGLFGLGLTILILALPAMGKRVERHRRRDRAQIFDRLPMGVASWSAEGVLESCNPAFAKRLGLSYSKLQSGTSYSDFRTLLKGNGNLEILSDDATGRYAQFSHDKGGSFLLEEMPLAGGGFMTLVTDRSDEQATRAELEAVKAEHRQLSRRLQEEIARSDAANRAKTSFLAHLSHEIRTPLNHIIGFADLVCHQSYGPLGDKRYFNYVGHIKQSGEHLLASFSEILELVELENGERHMASECVGVSDVLEAARKRFASRAERSGIKLTVSDTPGMQVRGDRHCFERMLNNVVENAVRFTPRGGQVTLAAWAADDGVVLEVSDTGIGMSREKLETLEEAFSLGDALFKRDHDGAGLGLAIARRIAELSGGKLGIESTRNIGTTVAIALPGVAVARLSHSRAA